MTDRRAVRADRRDDEKRRTLEMFLDRVFRPSRWAANMMYRAGLQGGSTIHVDRLDVNVRQRLKVPVRIVFASDFHAGPTTDVRVLETACAEISAQRPDVVLLGGDFVSVRGNDIHPLAELLAQVEAPFGKFGVYGNHDRRGNWPLIGKALAGAGVTMLLNERVQLAPPHADVSIIGLDDPILGDPEGALLDTASGVRVVLMHAPDGLLDIGDRPFDLAMCGHTHGGQIVIPGAPIPYLPHGELSRKYAVGIFDLGGESQGTLLVSRGVGCSTVPFRLACAPEIHVITLNGNA